MYRVNKIKKLADNFLKLTGVKLIKKAAELDEEASSLLDFLNKEIKSLRKNKEAKDLYRELRIFKAKYKKAVLINGGYEIINKNIKNILMEYGDLIFDEEDETPLENLLDRFKFDVINRAKTTSPSPQKERLILDAGRDAESEIDNEEYEGASETSSYDEGKESEREKEEDFGADYSTMEPGDNDFAKLELGKGKDEKLFGTQFGNRDYVNWKTKYEDKSRDILNEAKELNNPKAIEKANELKDLYNQLGAYIEYMQTAKDKISRIIEPTEKEEWRQKFTNANEKVGQLRKQVRVEMQKFRKLARAKYIQDLKEEYLKIKDPTEKFIKEQNIAIAETTQSGAKFIRPLQSLRRDMISKLKGKVYKDKRTGAETIYGKIALTPEVIEDFNNKVEEAKKKIISLKEWRKYHAEKDRSMLGVVEQTPKGKANIRDITLVKLKGHAKAIGNALLSERSTLKDRVVFDVANKIGSKESEEINKLIAEVAKAANALNASLTKLQKNPDNKKNIQKHNMNQENFHKAVHTFREYVKKLMDTEVKQKIISLKPKMTQLMISMRSSKFLYNYRNKLKAILPLEDKTSLSEKDVENIRDIISEGKKLAEYYINMKIPQIGEPEGRPTLWKNIGTPEKEDWILDVKKYLPEGKSPYETLVENINYSVEYLENLLATKPKEEKTASNIQERIFLLNKLAQKENYKEIQ